MTPDDTSNPAPPPGPPRGSREFRDEDNNRLDVSWDADATRARVRVDYFDKAGKQYWWNTADLAPRYPWWTFNPPAGNATIRLAEEDGQTVLLGCLPISYNAAIDPEREIARWPKVQAPEPEDGPDARASGSAALAPFAAPAVPGCGWAPAGSVIQNPACPQEILSILAVRPAAPPPEGPLLGFVLLSDPKDLPLYNTLSGLRTQPDGWSKMIAAAVDFAAHDPSFVPSLASLDTPASAYPFLVSQIRALRGEVSLDAVLQTVDTFLFAYGVGPLQEYLASAYPQQIEARVWQSLFAVTLGAPAPPPLPDDLVEVLQVDHFLRELERERGEAPPQPLTQPCGREEALGATVLLPEGVVPVEPACLEPPPPPPLSGPGWVKALGVGDLSRICQCLKGYGLGEVAQVVNVMERERLELSARELTRREETTETHQTEDLESTEEEARVSSSDLRNELEDVVAAEALCSQYNNLSQTYTETQVTLSGTWQGSEGVKERSDRQTRDLAEALTRRTASRLARKVAELRIHRHLREEERIDARDIDNRQGSGRLVGIYRWLHKIYEIALRGADKRLVVEFEIADPAAAFLLYIRNLYGVHLAPPQPPEDYGVKTWQDVTPENYLELASLYQIEVPPPPPATVSLIRSFQSQPPVFQAELEVPEGYQVTAGTVQYLLGDKSDNLVGYVGPASFAYPNTPPTAILGLLQTPAATSGSGGTGTCPTLADPFTYSQVPFQPFQGSSPLSLAGTTEKKLPAALLSTAVWFSATVVLTCGLPAGSELLTAWQIRTYDALVAGYLSARRRHEEEIRARIGAASAADKRRIERQQLQRRAFRILWSRRAPAAPPSGGAPVDEIDGRFRELFHRAFCWEEMTYAFHDWPPPPEPCRPNPCWPGQALIHAEADGLFESFLRARSARALVPVRPGFAAAVLFYLSFGLPWPGAPVEAPATAPDLAALADLRAPLEGCDGASWSLEIPTSMLVLQAGSELPTFPCALEKTS